VTVREKAKVVAKAMVVVERFWPTSASEVSGRGRKPVRVSPRADPCTGKLVQNPFSTDTTSYVLCRLLSRAFGI